MIINQHSSKQNKQQNLRVFQGFTKNEHSQECIIHDSEIQIKKLTEEIQNLYEETRETQTRNCEEEVFKADNIQICRTYNYNKEREQKQIQIVVQVTKDSYSRQKFQQLIEENKRLKKLVNKISGVHDIALKNDMEGVMISSICSQGQQQSLKTTNSICLQIEQHQIYINQNSNNEKFDKTKNNGQKISLNEINTQTELEILYEIELRGAKEEKANLKQQIHDDSKIIKSLKCTIEHLEQKIRQMKLQNQQNRKQEYQKIRSQYQLRESIIQEQINKLSKALNEKDLVILQLNHQLEEEVSKSLVLFNKNQQLSIAIQYAEIKNTIYQLEIDSQQKELDRLKSYEQQYQRYFSYLLCVLQGDLNVTFNSNIFQKEILNSIIKNTRDLVLSNTMLFNIKNQLQISQRKCQLIQQQLISSKTLAEKIRNSYLLEAQNELKKKASVQEMLKSYETQQIQTNITGNDFQKMQTEYQQFKIKEKRPLIQKIVHKQIFVDRIVYVQKEIPTLNIVQHIVQVPFDRFVQKIVDKVVQVPVYIPVQKIIEKIEYKIIELPIEIEIPVKQYVQVEKIVDHYIQIQKFVTVPQIIQKVIEKEIYRDHIIEKQIIVNKIHYIENTIQVEIPVPVPQQKIIIVQKIVKEQVEKLIEKVIEVPIQKIIQVPIEILVERIIIQEKIVEKVIQIEKIVEKPVIFQVQKVIQKYIDKIVEIPQIKYIENAIQIHIPGQTLEKIVEVIIDHEIEIPILHIVEVDRIVQIQKILKIEVPIERIIQKINQKIIQVPIVIQIQKIIEKVLQVQIQKVVQIPIDRIVEVQKTVQVQILKIIEVPVDRIVEIYIDKVIQVQKIVEIPKIYYIENTIQLEKWIESPPVIIEVPIEKVIERIETKEIQKIVEIQKLVEIVVEKYIEVPIIIEKIIEVDRIINTVQQVEILRIIQMSGSIIDHPSEQSPFTIIVQPNQNKRVAQWVSQNKVDQEKHNSLNFCSPSISSKNNQNQLYQQNSNQIYITSVEFKDEDYKSNYQELEKRLNKQYDSLKELNQDLHIQLTNEKTAKQILQTQLNNSLESNLKQKLYLQQTLSNKQSILSVIQKKLQYIQNELDVSHQENASLRLQIVKKEEELLELMKNNELKLFQQLNNKSNSLQSLEKQYHILTEKYMGAIEESEEYKRCARQLNQELIEYRNERDSILLEVGQYAQKINELQQQIIQLKDELNKQKIAKQKIEADVKGVEQEMQLLYREKEEAKTVYETMLQQRDQKLESFLEQNELLRQYLQKSHSYNQKLTQLRQEAEQQLIIVTQQKAEEYNNKETAYLRIIQEYKDQYINTETIIEKLKLDLEEATIKLSQKSQRDDISELYQLLKQQREELDTKELKILKLEQYIVEYEKQLNLSQYNKLEDFQEAINTKTKEIGNLKNELKTIKQQKQQMNQFLEKLMRELEKEKQLRTKNQNQFEEQLKYYEKEILLKDEKINYLNLALIKGEDDEDNNNYHSRIVNNNRYNNNYQINSHVKNQDVVLVINELKAKVKEYETYVVPGLQDLCESKQQEIEELKLSLSILEEKYFLKKQPNTSNSHGSSGSKLDNKFISRILSYNVPEINKNNNVESNQSNKIASSSSILKKKGEITNHKSNKKTKIEEREESSINKANDNSFYLSRYTSTKILNSPIRSPKSPIRSSKNHYLGDQVNIGSTKGQNAYISFKDRSLRTLLNMNKLSKLVIFSAMFQLAEKLKQQYQHGKPLFLSLDKIYILESKSANNNSFEIRYKGDHNLTSTNRLYQAPEILEDTSNFDNFVEGSIVWSLGILLDQLIHKRLFFKSEIEIIDKKIKYKYLDTNILEGKRILEKMLRKEVKQRSILSNIILELGLQVQKISRKERS